MPAKRALRAFGIGGAFACGAIYAISGFTLFSAAGLTAAFLILAAIRPTALTGLYNTFNRLRRIPYDLALEFAAAVTYTIAICGAGFIRRLERYTRIRAPFRSRSTTWIIENKDLG